MSHAAASQQRVGPVPVDLGRLPRLHGPDDGVEVRHDVGRLLRGERHAVDAEGQDDLLRLAALRVVVDNVGRPMKSSVALGVPAGADGAKRTVKWLSL